MYLDYAILNVAETTVSHIQEVIKCLVMVKLLKEQCLITQNTGSYEKCQKGKRR